MKPIEIGKFESTDVSRQLYARVPKYINLVGHGANGIYPPCDSKRTEFVRSLYLDWG